MYHYTKEEVLEGAEHKYNSCMVSLQLGGVDFFKQDNEESKKKIDILLDQPHLIKNVIFQRFENHVLEGYEWGFGN